MQTGRDSQPTEEVVRPSKTQRKQDMHALQQLGAELVALAPERLDRLDLPEPLREAVGFMQRITRHEARRRQLQYIGKLMRQVDAETIRAALDLASGDSRAAVALMHRCERWRQRLLDDDAALTELLNEVHGADAQWLRSAIRGARRERATNLAPRHARELYRELHRLLQAQDDAG
jgi:ribosome-associated protein